MSHHLYIRALNSEATKALEIIHSEREDFIKVLRAMTFDEEAKFIWQLLIDKKLIEPFSLRVPVLMVPTEEVSTLITYNYEAVSIFMWMLLRLESLGYVTSLEYDWHFNEKPVTVYIWSGDISKLSKLIRKKLSAV